MTKKFGLGIEHEVLLIKTVDENNRHIITDTDYITDSGLREYPLDDNSPTTRSRSPNFYKRNGEKLGDLHEDGSLGGISEFATGEYRNKTVEQASAMIRAVTSEAQLKTGTKQYPLPYITNRHDMRSPTSRPDSKSFITEAGSYHVTISLPFEQNPENRHEEEDEFIEKMQNFFRRLQWIEPLLVSCYGGCNKMGVGDGSNPKLNTEGSLRQMKSWGLIGVSNINKLVEDGHHGRYKEPSDSIPDIKNNDEIESYNNDVKADLRWGDRGGRRFGLFNGKDNGVEIRFLDSFSDVAIDDVIKIFVYIAENGQVGDNSENPPKTKIWNDATSKIFFEGWNAYLPKSYIQKLRQITQLPIQTFSQRAEDVLRQLTYELWYNHKNGEMAQLMIENNQTPPTIFNFSRDVWNHFFIINLQNNNNQFRKLKDIIKDEETFDSFQKSVRNKLGKKYSREEARDILDFLEYNGFINVIRDDNGSIYKYIRTDKSLDELDSIIEFDQNVTNYFDENNKRDETLRKLFKTTHGQTSQEEQLTEKQIHQYTRAIVGELRNSDFTVPQLYDTLIQSYPDVKKHNIRYILNEKLSPDYVIRNGRDGRAIIWSLITEPPAEMMGTDTTQRPTIRPDNTTQDQQIIELLSNQPDKKFTIDEIAHELNMSKNQVETKCNQLFISDRINMIYEITDMNTLDKKFQIKKDIHEIELNTFEFCFTILNGNTITMKSNVSEPVLFDDINLNLSDIRKIVNIIKTVKENHPDSVHIRNLTTDDDYIYEIRKFIEKLNWLGILEIDESTILDERYKLNHYLINDEDTETTSYDENTNIGSTSNGEGIFNLIEHDNPHLDEDIINILQETYNNDYHGLTIEELYTTIYNDLTVESNVDANRLKEALKVYINKTLKKLFNQNRIIFLNGFIDISQDGRSINIYNKPVIMYNVMMPSSPVNENIDTNRTGTILNFMIKHATNETDDYVYIKTSHYNHNHCWTEILKDNLYEILTDENIQTINGIVSKIDELLIDSQDEEEMDSPDALGLDFDYSEFNIEEDSEYDDLNENDYHTMYWDLYNSIQSVIENQDNSPFDNVLSIPEIKEELITHDDYPFHSEKDINNNHFHAILRELFEEQIIMFINGLIYNNPSNGRLNYDNPPLIRFYDDEYINYPVVLFNELESININVDSNYIIKYESNGDVNICNENNQNWINIPETQIINTLESLNYTHHSVNIDELIQNNTQNTDVTDTSSNLENIIMNELTRYSDMGDAWGHTSSEFASIIDMGYDIEYLEDYNDDDVQSHLEQMFENGKVIKRKTQNNRVTNYLYADEDLINDPSIAIHYSDDVIMIKDSSGNIKYATEQNPTWHDDRQTQSLSDILPLDLNDLIINILRESTERGDMIGKTVGSLMTIIARNFNIENIHYYISTYEMENHLEQLYEYGRLIKRIENETIKTYLYPNTDIIKDPTTTMIFRNDILMMKDSSGITKYATEQNPTWHRQDQQSTSTQPQADRGQYAISQKLSSILVQMDEYDLHFLLYGDFEEPTMSIEEYVTQIKQAILDNEISRKQLNERLEDLGIFL